MTRGSVLVACACAVAIAGCPRSAPPREILFDTHAEPARAPAGIAVTPDQRVFLSLHPAFEPPHPVVELRDGQLVPYAKAAELSSVLGIRADARGQLWMLDQGTRKVVLWNTTLDRHVRTIELGEVTPADASLDDLAVDRNADTIYIADPAGGANAALIVVDLITGEARRVLEGHRSVIPEEIDLVIDGRPVQVTGADGTATPLRVGISPIALDDRDEWLYFGPMHGKTLYRVRTHALRDPALTAEQLGAAVEVYAERPITDGIAIDEVGYIYLGDLAANAIGVIDRGRSYRQLARRPDLSWVAAFSFGPDGYYYVVVNQLHRSARLAAGGSSRPPFRILRFRPFAPGRIGR
jgi:sugar lactone lactonase YvrE